MTRSVPPHTGVTFMVQIEPALYQQSRPFVWFPLAGQRHAIDRRDRNVPDSPMRTLCGAAHPRGTEGDMEWLWPTCEQCRNDACKIVSIFPYRRLLRQ